jgi:hypothetical protein
VQDAPGEAARRTIPRGVSADDTWDSATEGVTMWKTKPGSTGRLLELCGGYFFCYVLTGIFAKVFTGGYPWKMAQMEFLFNNTLGSSLLAVAVAILLGWWHFKSNRVVKWGPLTVPSEIAYIIPSGLCTAVVVPTTTLMYVLVPSVMVAMVIMRGSIIVISRLIDAVQIQQGILKKRVYAEENWAVLFALLAVAVNIVLIPLVNHLEGQGVHAAQWAGIKEKDLKQGFDFLHSTAAMVTLGMYLLAYTFRLYIMNYFKNTRAKGVPLDNQGFFFIEQITASATMLALGALVFFGASAFGWTAKAVVEFNAGVHHPDPLAIASGIPYGVLAFFSVFIFMFKGRTATFTGLVNRLTSLLAGTMATLLMFFIFKAPFPTLQEWMSVGFILVAVYFAGRAEAKRTAELAREQAA